MSRPADGMEAQRRYGAWLAWGTRLGLGLLVLGFLLYVTGIVAAQMPIEQLPEYWSQPAPEMLRRTGMHPGWGWAALLPRSDMLTLAAIGLLAGCSIACLLAVIPVFARAKERVLAAVCVLEVLVLVLAASGVLTGAH